jgi:acylphosphatase
MKVRAHIFVSGVVQGVSFRHHIRLRALENKVTGWVRNLPNGGVEAVLEGNKKDVERVVEYCRTGPPNAFVSDLKITWGNFIGENKEFEIRH